MPKRFGTTGLANVIIYCDKTKKYSFYFPLSCKQFRSHFVLKLIYILGNIWGEKFLINMPFLRIIFENKDSNNNDCYAIETKFNLNLIFLTSIFKLLPFWRMFLSMCSEFLTLIQPQCFNETQHWLLEH